jgi:LacI family transcriptional regulator
MAVVGYDDIEFARLGAVPLTTISSPQEKLGVAVAELLLAEIASGGDPDEQRPRQLELEPRLVVRASTSSVSE